MTLQQLHYIIVISESGSFNKAAERLYVAQPSLTSAVKEIEGEFGIRIFHRSNRGVTLTNEGQAFLQNARQVYLQYENLLEKYGKGQPRKERFSVSTQHYSFAVKAFVELVKQFDIAEYEFAIYETMTRDIIEDVSTSKSEIGILYLNSFNRAALTKLLKNADLQYHHLIDCQPFVYLWKGHPLANEKEITFEQLKEYPCLSFEQGSSGSFYYAEEILSTNDYARMIKTKDRATMLNLMIGLNGYTLCSGIICEELNGSDYLAVPFHSENTDGDDNMEIVYITRGQHINSEIFDLYIEEMKRYLDSL